MDKKSTRNLIARGKNQNFGVIFSTIRVREVPPSSVREQSSCQLHVHRSLESHVITRSGAATLLTGPRRRRSEPTRPPHSSLSLSALSKGGREGAIVLAATASAELHNVLHSSGSVYPGKVLYDPQLGIWALQALENLMAKCEKRIL